LTQVRYMEHRMRYSPSFVVALNKLPIADRLYLARTCQWKWLLERTVDTFTDGDVAALTHRHSLAAECVPHLWRLLAAERKKANKLHEINMLITSFKQSIHRSSEKGYCTDQMDDECAHRADEKCPVKLERN